MSDNELKPSDFFSMPSNHTTMDKVALSITLACIEDYFKHHMKCLRKLEAKEELAPVEEVVDVTLFDQMVKSCVVLYASVSAEDRFTLTRYARNMLVNNPDAIPNLPKVEELF
jgi:hypothetical protein